MAKPTLLLDAHLKALRLTLERASEVDQKF